LFYLKIKFMPGFEFFGEEERKEVNDVLETGILMRYGFDGPRKGIWKSKELEAAICKTFGSTYFKRHCSIDHCHGCTWNWRR
jgi:hypothetical protein